ncbi:hypothetical protein VTO42DRAFT_8901 [Malbranchea cinnamomea]
MPCPPSLAPDPSARQPSSHSRTTAATTTSSAGTGGSDSLSTPVLTPSSPSLSATNQPDGEDAEQPPPSSSSPPTMPDSTAPAPSADGNAQDHTTVAPAQSTQETGQPPADDAASQLPPTATTTTTTPSRCKRHPHPHGKAGTAKLKAKKNKKKAETESSSDEDADDESSDTDQSSSSSSSTSSSDSSDSDADSSSDSDHKKSMKKKNKKAKARKLKEEEEEGEEKKKKKKKNKKKNRKKRKAESWSSSSSSSSSSEEEDSSSDDSSDDDDDSSSEDEKARKKKKKKKSKRSQKKKDKESTQQGEAEAQPTEEQLKEEIRAAQQKLFALQLSKHNPNPPPVRRLNSRMPGFPVGDRALPADPNNANQQKAKGKKSKRASKVAFKRVDQLWDSSIHNYKLTETVEDPDADEWDQYIFTVRRKFDWENKYTETVVDIKSRPLRDALQHVMAGVKCVSLVQETPVVDPNVLFLYLEETRQYMNELRQLAKTEKHKKTRRLAKTKAQHLKVLVKYLDSDYAETKKTLYPLLENHTITFDLLWALYKPNTIAYTPTYGDQDEPRAFKIEYATKESSLMRGQWYCVEGRYLEYDGKSFGMGTMAADVESFKGPRKISSLSCYPIQYHRDPEGLKAKLIERGKKFVSLQGMNYKFHRGMAYYKKRRSVVKVNINGRVMVDPAIHRRINPNYPISIVRPKDPDALLDGSDGGSNGWDTCCCGGSDDGSDRGRGNSAAMGRRTEAPRTRLKVVHDRAGKPHLIEVEYDENGNEITKENIEKLQGDGDGNEQQQQPQQLEFTEEELLIASPVVLGFAFSEKLWLEFTVSGISDIEWNSGAFNSLVLPGNQKSIVKALVESHTFRAAENIDDVIQGKGRGLVVVLHGPPGTGKTLTAEGIAELLKRPLYMVSAGELGTDSRMLEAELTKILDIAHSWGAVLLLDEADVFLEKRTIHDIHRNALVSIFLRLLEYFQGILFLTTNRVETFDDAFQSRIHVALRYGDLTTKAKRAVWKVFLEKVQQQAKEAGETAIKFSEKDYDALARHNLNGRQIKNSVRTAQALALNEKTPLSMEHINRVLDVAETFDRDLKGGTGYMDAMRSYT